MSKLTGAEIVVECLKEQGIDTVFGYPGDTILNIYDALYQRQGGITHILTSHEQGVSHAVGGYVRATDRVGVCLATSGPGTTNLITGIATAYMDSIPVVAITYSVTNSLLGKDSFQEIDITGVTMSITRYNFVVKDVNRLAMVIRRALTITQTGHPDPVLVDTTKDVTATPYEYEKQVPEEIVRQSDAITERDMNRAVEMIHKASRPFIFVGGDAVLTNASNELRVFAYKIRAPVTNSLMGKGAFDGTDELYTGTVGMHGTETSNFGMTGADLLIMVGARFSDRVTGNTSEFVKNAEIPRLDIDPIEVNRDIKVDTGIIGDVKVILRKLNARLDPVNRDEWIAHVERMKGMYPLRCDKNPLTGPFIVQTANEVTGGDTVIATEVGQHQMWAAQYYQYHQPRTLLTSEGLGTMGYGLGAAVGTRVGCRDKTVINIVGDGYFRISMNEIVMTAQYDIPVMEVTVNNHVLGMVRQWQTLFYGKCYPRTVLDDSVDFMKIAEAVEVRAYRVTQKEELEPVLREAISLNTPVVIDYQISCDDEVFPMISSGAPVADVLDDTDLKIN